MIIAYKAFDKDLSCTSGRNKFQYKVGEWNEETEANCAQNGFHCAENPMDCLSYYPTWEKAVYYAVIANGDVNEDGTDSKISCTKMKLVKELTKEEFVYASIAYMVSHPKRKKNSRVYNEIFQGIEQNGFAIVRGKSPKASGKLGMAIGFAKEEIDSSEITDISIITIDGEEFKEETMYCFDGSEARGKLS
ncbi:MAG: hypothetical protein PHX08_01145 [Lachnospiraceae bacterium]|nr:hypothetical protein [Lachnospiraceae bacterium]